MGSPKSEDEMADTEAILKGKKGKAMQTASETRPCPRNLSPGALGLLPTGSWEKGNCIGSSGKR
jgi:hypothetical protein